jgi:hypothetical protein
MVIGVKSYDKRPCIHIITRSMRKVNTIRHTFKTNPFGVKIEH